MRLYNGRMLNDGTGLDETKYFAMIASVAVVEASPRVRAKILKRLIESVTKDARRRVVSRDVDVLAATRVRSWLDE